MPQKPEDLSRLIQQIAQKEAAQRGISLSPQALDRIGRIPSEYAALPTIPVDVGRLTEMIRDIVELAMSVSGNNPEIDQGAIETSLKNVHCHYLWFC